MNAAHKSSATHPDTATYRFADSADAWLFTFGCDSHGISAGYPSVDGLNTVKVSLRTWMDREKTDALAAVSGAPMVDYDFG